MQNFIAGGKAVAVPGEVKGYYEAWKRFGVVDWSTLVQPAIKLCEQGFIVDKPLATSVANWASTLLNDSNFR
jgi:gamma-glutamyltranspeptidase/glutathione hydrolase/leukotriene-C4 hydrolase